MSYGKARDRCTVTKEQQQRIIYLMMIVNPWEENVVVDSKYWIKKQVKFKFFILPKK